MLINSKSIHETHLTQTRLIKFQTFYCISIINTVHFICYHSIIATSFQIESHRMGERIDDYRKDLDLIESIMKLERELMEPSELFETVEKIEKKVMSPHQ